KEKVNQARIVIILLSKEYCESRTCKRQAFYCDFRKQVLPVQLEDIREHMPHWASKLMCIPDLIRSVDPNTHSTLPCTVLEKLQALLHCKGHLNSGTTDEKI